jgi:hypothetical protein
VVDPTYDPLGPWPCYCSNEPETGVDDVVTIYDTAGEPQIRAQWTGEQDTYWGIQVRVRSTDHHTGWRQANAIRTFLAQTVSNTLVNVEDVQYDVHAYNKIGDVITLGKDRAAKRSVFTINLTVVITNLSL